jgi:NAD(P)H-hydrate repair Nnr-like enzyme with NAD(P)H-hydrate dehydratase domain
MVRYGGPATPTALVLARRPETVVGAGRADAWVVGSGIPNAAGRSHDDELRVRAAFAGGVPAVVDAGALDVLDAACGPVVITPHFRELERVLAVTAHPLALDEISADPAAAAVRAADALGVAVLLKGATTRIALPGGFAYAVRWGTPWLATAGTGDVLAGIIGALLAAHAGTARHLDDVAMIAATGAVVHGLAGRIAAGDPDGLGAGAPITALDVADAVPDAIEELTARR